MAHSVPDGDCRRWIGARNQYGYGRLTVHKGEKVLVHRLMHELAIGPIPQGYEVDHVYARGCRFSDCILPEHLEAVTPRENALRGIALRDGAGMCRSGLHPMTPDNVHVVAATGRRRCRACVRDRKRRDYYAKKLETSNG